MNEIIYVITSLIVTVFLYGVVIYYLWSVINNNKHVIYSKKFSSKKKLRMIYNLLIRTSNIRNMHFVLILLGFTTLISLSVIGSMLFLESVPEYYTGLTILISSLISGLSGFIQYKREETPSRLLDVEKGITAKFSGIVLMLFFWGISISSVIYGIISWLK